MSSSVFPTSETYVSRDLTVKYGDYPADGAPLIIQSELHPSGSLFTAATSAKKVTLFDAFGMPAIGAVESESLTLTHMHPCFADALIIAWRASASRELLTIYDLISRVNACKCRHLLHLGNHNCLYNLKHRPAHLSSSDASSVIQRLINVRGVLESHCIEHDLLLSALDKIFQDALRK